MLLVESQHLEIIQKILSKYPYGFYAFGSRVAGKPKKFSDLDLCFFEEIPDNIRDHIDEDFEESDLPYKVDIINWNTCSPAFQTEIRKNLLCIKKSTLFPI